MILFYHKNILFSLVLSFIATKVLGFHSFAIEHWKIKPPLIDIKRSSIMPSRRLKTTRKVSTDNEETSKPDLKDQLALVHLYRGVAMMHGGQILLAFKKSGYTIACFNVIGGPLMAAGICYILGNAASTQCLANSTFKRLNGLLFMYSSLAYCLIALVPQLNSSLGMLWFLSASSTIFITVKGYLSALKADNNKGFLIETCRLFNEAFQVTLSLTKIPSKEKIGDFASLWIIALKKVALIFAIVQVLLSSGFARSQIAPKINQIMKLTILGGSIVINLLIGNDIISEKTVMFPLNVLISYVLASMAAFGISTAKTPLLMVEGIALAFCAALAIVKLVRKKGM